jgi:hypothetical protein
MNAHTRRLERIGSMVLIAISHIGFISDWTLIRILLKYID